jgi:hypothetical protein
MLALLAAVVFLLALLGVPLGSVNLITLGLFLMALHLAFGPVVASHISWGPRA